MYLCLWIDLKFSYGPVFFHFACFFGSSEKWLRGKGNKIIGILYSLHIMISRPLPLHNHGEKKDQFVLHSDYIPAKKKYTFFHRAPIDDMHIIGNGSVGGDGGGFTSTQNEK